MKHVLCQVKKCSRTVQLLLPLSALAVYLYLFAATHGRSDQVTEFSTELYAVKLQLKQTENQPHSH